MNRKILIVDDEPNILHSFQRGLRQHFEVSTAEDGQSALLLTEAIGPFAAVVADMRMPGMNGAEFLNHMQSKAPDTVRIMLTGNLDQATAVAAVNKGRVFQFLNKPCAIADMIGVLERAIVVYAEAQRTQDELLQNRQTLLGLNAQLEYQKRHDLITGLANRYALEQHLSALHKDRRNSGSFAILHWDLDHFHLINDAYGHVAGDYLLREIARLLSAGKRDEDFLSRLSSDEFVLVLKEVDQEMAEMVSTRLLDSIRAFRFHWEARHFDITASAGLIRIRPNADIRAQDLLSRAQTACLVAKEQGRDRLHVGSENDSELTQKLNQSQFVTHIKQALEENRFKLYFQPIVPIGEQTDRLHGEVLVRMLGEDGSLIPPGKFLPLLEQYHLAPRMDCWVIENISRWLQQNPQIHKRLELLSINLSGLSIGDPVISDYLVRYFPDNGLNAGKICLEVTETAAVSRLNLALDFIKQLQQRGFRFALDDFGVGMSSFGYLRNLPVDILKIDGTFVKDMDVDPIDHAMVKSISEVGRVMGKRMVAEYVENQSILEQLQQLGVDYAQGYHIARPSPLDLLSEPS